MMSVATSILCPGCARRDIRIFYEARKVPVHSVLLLDSRQEALDFPRGDVILGFCRGCGFIHNVAFDPTRLGYSQRYEETQGFSPTFQSWHRTLAERLIARHALRGKRVVEIGCGKGEFLTLLCELGDNEGVGFDPAYVPERNAARSMSRIEFVQDFYGPTYRGLTADLVCCKMTLEHIHDVGRFVRLVRESIGDRPETVVFFQVPDAERILEDLAFWDIYYEHCSYFSPLSLTRLFEMQGFEVLDVSREYAGQYVAIEARPRMSGGRRAVEADTAPLSRLVEKASRLMSDRISHWRRQFCRWRAERRRVAVWGSGSKGVAFLTTINEPGVVSCVVDVNPFRQGHFMAGTGEPIVSPEALREHAPEVVLIMNPVYRDEITRDLARLGLTPEVRVV